MLHDKWTIVLQFFIIYHKKILFITEAQQRTTEASYPLFLQSQVQKMAV